MVWQGRNNLDHYLKAGGRAGYDGLHAAYYNVDGAALLPVREPLSTADSEQSGEIHLFS